MDRAQHALLEYYERTASTYDSSHEGDEEHLTALGFLAGFILLQGAGSILDVGTGTGRGIRFLSEAAPRVHTFGVDLSFALLGSGIEKGHLNPNSVCVADASQLPFQDACFDFAFETGILHHVAAPAKIVSEMLRVSKLGIAVSDSNMYVSGDSFGFLPKGLAGSAIKMLLARSGIWGRLKRVLRGREWSYSEGDGVFWTYSVYDSLLQIQQLCRRVFVIPLKGGKRMNEIPLLDASNLLVIALKT